MKDTLIERFSAYAATHTWAWPLLRYLVIPVEAAWDILTKHVPELVADVRAEWAELDVLRAEYVAKTTTSA